MATNRAELPLPFDVWDHIFNILEQEDAETQPFPMYRPRPPRERWCYTSLKACNAASYALHAICQPLLFRSVTVAIRDASKHSIQSFLHLFQGNQSLRHHVRRLTLIVSHLSSTVTGDSEGMCGVLVSTLQGLDGLRSLDCHIEGNWVLVPPVFRDTVIQLLSSPAVTTIKIARGAGWPLSVFSNFPQVEDLTIGFVEWQTDVEEPREVDGGLDAEESESIDGTDQRMEPLRFDLPNLERLDLEIFSAPSGTIETVLPGILRASPRLKDFACNIRGQGRSWVEHAAYGLANALSLSPSLAMFKLKAQRAELLPENVTGIATELDNILRVTPHDLKIVFELETGEREMTFWMSDDWLEFDRALSQAQMMQPKRDVHLSLVTHLSETRVLRGTVPVWQLPTYLPTLRQAMGERMKVQYLPDELNPVALYATTLC